MTSDTTHEAVDALGWGMHYDELPPPTPHAPQRHATTNPGEFIVFEPNNKGAVIWSDTTIPIHQ